MASFPSLIMYFMQILLFLSSAQPINISNWVYIDPTDGFIPCDSEQVGGYDYDNNVIRIFGGVRNASSAYTFNTSSGDFSSYEPVQLSPNVVSAEAQSFTQSESTIYFYDDTNSKHVIGTIDLTSEDVGIFALTVVDNTDPMALCIDTDTTTVFIVGNAGIESCTSSGCSLVAQSNLTDIDDAACEYIDGSVYVFGGGSEGVLVDSVFECDASVEDSCNLIATLSTPRQRIRSVQIQCTFQTEVKYVALIGGSTSTTGTPSDLVEIFSVDEQTVTLQESLGTARDRFVAIFDPDNEGIFVFGGVQNTNLDCVDNAELIEATTGPGGICYTLSPTLDPTMSPTFIPTDVPSGVPSFNPTIEPTMPTAAPTEAPKEKTATVIFIVLAILVIFFLMLFGDYYFARKEREEERERLAQESIALSTVAGGTQEKEEPEKQTDEPKEEDDTTAAENKEASPESVSTEAKEDEALVQEDVQSKPDDAAV